MTTPDTRIDELCNDTGENMTGGLPFLSSSFNCRLGQWFGGYFVDLRTKKATNLDGTPNMWTSGPFEGTQKEDLLFILWCPDEPRDTQNPLDNGLRILAVTKHYSHVDTSMWGALLKSWEDAGKRHNVQIKGPRRGGRIMMLHERTETREEVVARKGTNPAKIWRADYQLPTPEIVAHLDSIAPAGTPTQLTAQPSANGHSASAGAAVSTLPPPPAPTSVPMQQGPPAASAQAPQGPPAGHQYAAAVPAAPAAPQNAYQGQSAAPQPQQAPPTPQWVNGQWVLPAASAQAPQGPPAGHQYAAAVPAAPAAPQNAYQGQSAAPQPPDQNPFGPVPPQSPAAVQQAAAGVATAHQPPQQQGPPPNPYQ